MWDHNFSLQPIHPWGTTLVLTAAKAWSTARGSSTTSTGSTATRPSSSSSRRNNSHSRSSNDGGTSMNKISLSRTSRYRPSCIRQIIMELTPTEILTTRFVDTLIHQFIDIGNKLPIWSLTILWRIVTALTIRLTFLAIKHEFWAKNDFLKAYYSWNVFKGTITKKSKTKFEGIENRALFTGRFNTFRLDLSSGFEACWPSCPASSSSSGATTAWNASPWPSSSPRRLSGRTSRTSCSGPSSDRPSASSRRQHVLKDFTTY